MERIGAYNIDEIRDKEDLPELENGLGKKHLISLNYTFLDKLEEYQMSKGQSNNKEPTDSNQEAEINENNEEVKEVQEDE